MSNATARMTKSLVKNVRRPGVVPALVTALGVLGFLVLQRVLSTLVSLIGIAGYTTDGTVSGLYELEQPGIAVTLWVGAMQELLLVAVPFAFGVFVSLWILAPIADSLRLRHVFARATLAAAIGTGMVFLVGAIAAFATAVSQAGSLFGNSFPWPSPFAVLNPLLQALITALSVFVAVLPVVLLAGVLLWTWLRGRDAPHEVSGILDEV